ncbi:MAG: hypothetical protein QXU21_02095, partial [Candidatus Bathyarchaeia archaeon]
MAQFSPEDIWQMTAKELSELLDSGMFLPKTGKVYFYAPSFMYYRTSYFCSSIKDFPTISVTGKGCALNCRH